MENNEQKLDEKEVLIKQNVQNVATPTPTEKVISQMVVSSEKLENKDDSNDDIFIDEKEQFLVTVKYYNDEKNELFVERVDDNFDKEKKDIKSFDVSFKYPSHGDYEAILNSPVYKSVENLRMPEIIQLELLRMGILLRSWTLNKRINQIVQLKPKIVKGIMLGVREKISMDGIL
jgi:hypothetical protein